ncbi:MAG TPA: DUF3459 domain-containing protein, partial [Streptosporangiaceae bacterium]|nr:DUF3459 domain-containing protein [Streptosporangiaceae bacterium]
LYRTALALRRADGELADDTLTWLDAQPGVLAFSRPGGLLCVVNISGVPASLPAHDEVVLASEELAGGLLPADAAAWLRVR